MKGPEANGDTFNKNRKKNITKAIQWLRITCIYISIYKYVYHFKLLNIQHTLDYSDIDSNSGVNG